MAKRSRRRGRNRIGKIPAFRVPASFEVGKGFVTAVIHIDDDATIGIKFESPEQLLGFFMELMEHAVIAWPDDPFIKYYLEEQ